MADGGARMFTHALGDDAHLALLEDRHADALFALTDANRDHLTRWLPWVEKTRSVADSRAFVHGARERFARGNGFDAGIWSGDALAGVIGLHGIDRGNRATSIGYWIGRAFEGRGLVTRATAAIVDHAFRDLGLHRVAIRCAPGNVRSRAIPERLGFTEEGTLRHAQKQGDAWLDLVVYGMLAHEWKGLTPARGP